MNWITDHFALGDYLDAAAMPPSIDRVLNVAGEAPVQHLLPTLHLDLHDGFFVPDEDFMRAFVFLAQSDLAKQKTLVHCMAGVSRSPVVLAMYLALRNGTRFGDELDEIKQQRTVVDPSPVVARSARDFVLRTQAGRTA